MDTEVDGEMRDERSGLMERQKGTSRVIKKKHNGQCRVSRLLLIINITVCTRSNSLIYR